MLATECPGAIVDEAVVFGELTLDVNRSQVRDVCAVLQRPPWSFTLLRDLTCTDFPDEPGRFRLAYQLYSIETNASLRLRAWAGAEDPQVPSVEPVWPTANWLEREVYDMFGVRFGGHPDLARILMPDDWVGHPLRKDYPLGGEEVAFSDER